MSWWVTKHGEGGSRELWIVDVDPLLTICVLVLPTLVLVVNGLLSTALLVGGAICVLVAKISLFRRGTWVSWGPRLLAPRNASLYKLGYTLIAIGAVLRLALRV